MTAPARLRPIVLAAFAVAAFVGCKPKIGDHCASSTDCSQTGDRLCDTTQPGGYCTIFNCEPDGCPVDEAVCVAFYPNVCGDPQRSPRYERTFCMAMCSGDSDCRGGYACVDMGAQVIDRSPPTRRVCMVPPQTTPVVDAGICDAISPSVDAFPFPDATAGFDAAAEAGPGDAAADATPDAGADAAGSGDAAVTDGPLE